jgi:hypothetical protein
MILAFMRQFTPAQRGKVLSYAAFVADESRRTGPEN